MIQNLPHGSMKLLFQSISQGDIGAFRELFDSYNKRLFAAAFKLTKSRITAEDIVQEVFAALWEHKGRLGTVDHPEAYIFTIAYNKTYRHLKKIASDARLYESLKEQIKVAHDSTEEWLDVKETQQIIDREVEKLPSKRQLIYKLSRKDGLTHQQIAEHLNISPLTVKKQIALALRQIRAGLGQTTPVFLLLFIFL